MSDDREYATGGYLPDGWVYEVQGGCIVPPYGARRLPGLDLPAGSVTITFDNAPGVFTATGQRIEFGPPVPKLFLIWGEREPPCAT